MIFVFIYIFALLQKNNGQYDLSDGFSNSVRGFLPFGNLAPSNVVSNNQNLNPNSSPSNISSTTLPEIMPRLREISSVPVAGSEIVARERDVVVNKVKTKVYDQYIRFVDRATGHVFETKSDSPAITEISDTTIPKVYEVDFSSNPNVAIFRSLDESTDTILSEVATLASSTLPIQATSTAFEINSTSTTTSTSTVEVYTGTPYKTEISYLPNNIANLAVGPSLQKMIYSLPNASGGNILVSNIDGSKPLVAFTSALSGWLLSWPNSKYTVLTTKPSGFANGISLLLNLSSGSLSKIASGNGLTTLVSPDLSTALVGKGGLTMDLSAENLKDSSSLGLSLQTLPEKCVWANTENSIAYCAIPNIVPKGTYPDDWYQGLISFTDNIWEINTSTGVSNIVAALSEDYNQNIDAINLQISSDDSYLTFMNKDDLTLWGYWLRLATSTQATSTTASTNKSNSASTSATF